MVTTDELICAVLRGDRSDRGGDAPVEAEEILSRTVYHGVHALMYESLEDAPSWPPALLHGLRTQSLMQAMWELQHQQVLKEALAALSTAQVEPVLIKGTAMAYGLYPSPVLRTRGDTDLLIPLEARHRAHDALVGAGFVRHGETPGELHSYQASYVYAKTDGNAHIIDLHWKINNSEVLSQLFAFEELREERSELPPLGPNAWRPSHVHSLLVTCVHRSTHRQNAYYVQDQAHYGDDRLIWTYDIHLLASSFTAADWSDAQRLCRSKQVCGVVLDGLVTSRACFRTDIPADFLAALTQAGDEEISARYLNSPKLVQQWMDFRALPRTRDRLQYLAELFFPPSNYIRQKYPATPARWIGWLYLRRIGSGMLTRLRAPRNSA